VTELFDEVDEDVRRDQLKKLWDQYSIYIIVGALLIVAAVGGWRGYQYMEAKKAAEVRPLTRPLSFPSGTSIPRRKRPSTAWLPARRRGIACWRGCAPRRKPQATIRKPR
jgi:hypothetical protein